MSAQALYRAWRPTRFHDAIGQQAIVTTLQNQVASGRVSHAYLFCGSRGTGKTTFAKILARAVNCLSPVEGDLCGVCSVCEALSAENNLDIVEIDAASNNGVDEIRDLRDKIKFPPQHGKYRVYIIDEVHMLSAGAFNALLKTLEEPPSHAIFILATTEPQKLPATILSRCQRYDFKRYTVQTIVEWMKTVVSGERADVSEDALSLIASSAEGGMRDALSLLDMCIAYGGGSADVKLVREILGAADRGFLFAFVDHVLSGDAAASLRDIDALMRNGLDPQVFIRDVTRHLRALLLSLSCGEGLADLLQTTDEEAELYQKQAKYVSRERLLSLLDLFLASESNMKWASQPRIALEAGVARACLPEDSLRLDALATRLELVEKKIENGTISTPSKPAEIEILAERINALSALIHAKVSDAASKQNNMLSDEAAESARTTMSDNGQMTQSAMSANADLRQGTTPADAPTTQNTDPIETSTTQKTILTDIPAAQNMAPANAPTTQNEPTAKAELLAEITPAESQALWEKALKLFRKEAPGIYSQLLLGRFEGFEGNVAYMTFQKEKEINLNMLKLPLRLSQMEEIMSEAAGKPMKFRLELENKQPAAQPQQDGMLRKVFDVFGRENVQVVDDPS